jgi:hypothetical protein
VAGVITLRVFGALKIPAAGLAEFQKPAPRADFRPWRTILTQEI